jgi:hypothetical protein
MNSRLVFQKFFLRLLVIFVVVVLLFGSLKLKYRGSSAVIFAHLSNSFSKTLSKRSSKRAKKNHLRFIFIILASLFVFL